MRRSKGFVGNKAQPSVISLPYSAKASMVNYFICFFIRRIFGGFYFFKGGYYERKIT